MPIHQPSADELREAFRRSGLWRLGWTYAEAIAVPVIVTTLTMSCEAQKRQAIRRGQAIPNQPALL